MPVLSRYDAASDAVVPSGLGRYDPTSSDSSQCDSGKLSCICGLCANPGLCETPSKWWNLGLQAARTTTPCLFQRWLTQNLLPVRLVVMMVVKGDEWISQVRDCNQCMQSQPIAKSNPCPSIPPMVLQNRESERLWKSQFVHVNALFHFESCFELLWPSGCSPNRVRIQCCGQYSMRIPGMVPRRIGSLKDPHSVLYFFSGKEKLHTVPHPPHNKKSRTPMLQSGMDASLGHWQEAFTPL